MYISLILVLAVWIVFHLYVLKRLPAFSESYKHIRKAGIILNIILLLFIITVIVFLGLPHHQVKAFRFFFLVNFVFIFTFIPLLFYSILFLLSDLYSAIIYIFKKSASLVQFRKYMFKFASVLIILFWLMIVYGLLIGKSAYRIQTVNITHNSLPESFNNLQILHFSDTHLGSFFCQNTVKRGLQLIQKQNVDLIMFTGDLVNISAEEAYPYIDMFRQIQAPLGKYAVLGNHDMSDYRKMDIDRDSLNVNTNDIVRALHDMGFIVLRDSALIISNNTDSIAIAGTDNWGVPPFQAYGNIDKAMSYIPDETFTILLSHDPSIWDELIVSQNNIALTLSGHTHGMQFGLFTNRIKWSPAQYIYEHWGGLFQKNEQYLYVNTGFGYIGFPGRIGMHPEITLITLKHAAK